MEGDVCICMADAQKTTKCYKAIILQLKNKLKKKKKEYWNGLPCPRPGDLPDSGIKPMSQYILHWQEGSLPSVPITWYLFFSF